MALLGGIALCALPLALVFQSREDAGVGSFASGPFPASLAGFSRDMLIAAPPGARWTLSPATGDATVRDTYYAVFQGIELSGRRLDRVATSDWQECAALCLRTKDCTGFAFSTTTTPSCELKAGLSSSRTGQVISGALFHGTTGEADRLARDGVRPTIYRITARPGGQ
jgi:hypothetical protein